MSPHLDPGKTAVVDPNGPTERTRSDVGSGVEARRLCLLGVKIDSTLRHDIDEYAKAHGTSRSRAASQYLAIARETLRGREGVPAGKGSRSS